MRDLLKRFVADFMYSIWSLASLSKIHITKIKLALFELEKSFSSSYQAIIILLKRPEFSLVIIVMITLYMGIYCATLKVLEKCVGFLDYNKRIW